MDCPRCQGQLNQAQRMGVEIDFCPRCRGVWLDGGELETLIERSQAYELAPPPQGYAASYQPPAAQGYQASTQGYPPNPGYAPQHHDSGRREDHRDSRHDSHRDDHRRDDHRRHDHKRDEHRRDHDDHHHGHKHKKKKGFLGELFDIFD